MSVVVGVGIGDGGGVGYVCWRSLCMNKYVIINRFVYNSNTDDENSIYINDIIHHLVLHLSSHYYTYHGMFHSTSCNYNHTHKVHTEMHRMHYKY